MLSVTNQLDATQRCGRPVLEQRALRQHRCAPGTASSAAPSACTATSPDAQPQVHGNINDNSRFNGAVVDGVLMRDLIVPGDDRLRTA